MSPEALSLKHCHTEVVWRRLTPDTESAGLGVWHRCWNRCFLVGAPSNSKTWKLQPHGSSFRVKDVRKELWNLQLWLRTVFKAKCVLHAQEALCRVVKTDSALCLRSWRLARNQLRRERCVQSTNGRSWWSAGWSDMKREMHVCPSGFQSCFWSSISSLWFFFSFWNGYVWSGPFYVGSR